MIPAALEPPTRRTTPVASTTTLALVLLVFGGGSLATAAGLGWRHFHASRGLVDDARRRAIDETARTAAAIDALLRGVVPQTETAARQLAAPGVSEADAVEKLTGLARRSVGARGIGAAYQPFAIASGRRLFAPYILIGRDHAIRRVQIEDRYDYTKFEHRWYGDPLLDGAMWNEPLEGPAGEGMLAMYTVPIVRSTGGERDGPMGVAFTTVSVDAITRLLDALALGSSGYGFVFSAQGRYISHPRSDLVRRGTTVFEAAWTADDTSLHSMAIHSLKGERGLADSIDPKTGQELWIVYEPIKTTRWTLAVTYYEEAFRLDADRQRRDAFRITASAILGGGLIGLGLLVMLIGGRAAWLWAVASTLTLLLVVGIAALWIMSSRYPSRDDNDRTRVPDAASAEQYLRTYEQENGHDLQRIPTGIFLKSIEFLSNVNVAVAGYVWQRLPAPAPARPEFVLADADRPDIREVSRRRAGADEVVLWSFAANVRESFSYEKYPLDRHAVWIRLQPGALDRPAVLTPDFGSYQVHDPGVGPGVSTDLVLPGWRVSGSSFDYRPAIYNATFGGDRVDATSAPELYFNVSVTRRFLGPFVSNIVPLSVAGVMIFALLIISSKNESRSRFAGFTAKDIVKGAAAVFFVISFQHIALRNALGSERLMYFEYFYFTAYLGMLLVTLNGILFASDVGGGVVHFRDNLLPKLAFWPAAMACLFAITLVVFY